MSRRRYVDEQKQPADTPFQTLLAYKGAVNNVSHSHRVTPATRHETCNVPDADHGCINVNTILAVVNPLQSMQLGPLEPHHANHGPRSEVMRKQNVVLPTAPTVYKRSNDLDTKTHGYRVLQDHWFGQATHGYTCLYDGQIQDDVPHGKGRMVCHDAVGDTSDERARFFMLEERYKRANELRMDTIAYLAQYKNKEDEDAKTRLKDLEYQIKNIEGRIFHEVEDILPSQGMDTPFGMKRFMLLNHASIIYDGEWQNGKTIGVATVTYQHEHLGSVDVFGTWSEGLIYSHQDGIFSEATLRVNGKLGHLRVEQRMGSDGGGWNRKDAGRNGKDVDKDVSMGGKITIQRPLKHVFSMFHSEHGNPTDDPYFNVDKPKNAPPVGALHGNCEGGYLCDMMETLTIDGMNENSNPIATVSFYSDKLNRQIFLKGVLGEDGRLYGKIDVSDGSGLGPNDWPPPPFPQSFVVNDYGGQRFVEGDDRFNEAQLEYDRLTDREEDWPERPKEGIHVPKKEHLEDWLKRKAARTLRETQEVPGTGWYTWLLVVAGISVSMQWRFNAIYKLLGIKSGTDLPRLL